ncbi:P-loop containing nucleoside triphosphate hydrolase protein [Suillus paluster]|uniref:P-loop containing nucleoside triphosphate hydrolase protein n=1 Tax=Suillus paluster TaxID=48578 RepID=UPI001B87DCB8|nr:P-loop containing nucleoside triphosphate hydrolase protein [Suillus paluster]KAG1741506.1 P-loop containing nucleoside triphosphate hydrolase protein [Suillus paluster]
MSVSYTGSASSKHAEEASDTCNIVIFGEAGAGKSSLINLITSTETAPTSCDTLGCTIGTNVYEHYVGIQGKILKVNLFDTAGLDEGSEGIVPDGEARKILKELLRTLLERDGIHLLIYCVRSTKGIKALCRNYELCLSEVKQRVPIVLVVTGLEDKLPEMEGWWKTNQQSISQFGMTFAGHACITALTLDGDATDTLKRRRHQSYDAVCKLIEECRAKNKPKNIVIFGETGAGKSSLVNLMARKEVADTSPDTKRCTLHWKDYTIGFGGESYKVFDTVGLEEPQLGITEYLGSVENAYRLIKELDRQGGIDLLLFCIRAGRLSPTIQSNYRLFHEFLCEKKVPIVLAITNLEREKRMEDWWEREHNCLEQHGILVAGHACITAANKLDGRHKDLYEESRVTIRNLVKQYIADKQKPAWIGGDNLFVALMRKLKELLERNSRLKRKDVASRLTKRCGMSKEVAKELANMIKYDVVAAG